MRFLNKVLAEAKSNKPSFGREYEIHAAKVTLYRGTKDILPSKIDHDRINNKGLWGPGTYLSPDPKVAAWYAFKDPEKFGVLVKYEVTNVKILKLKTPSDFVYDEKGILFGGKIKLTKKGSSKLGLSGELEPEGMVEIARNAGYDAIEIDDTKRQSTYSEHMIILFTPGKLKPAEFSTRLWDQKTAKYIEHTTTKATQLDAIIKAGFSIRF